MTITQASVIEEYKNCTHDTNGCPGFFATDELQKLAKLWSLILEYLEENKDKQIPVSSSLLQRVNNSWSELPADDNFSNAEDYEEITRQAWKFTKSEPAIRKLSLLSRKPNPDQQRLLLERHVSETTQEYINRKSGYQVPLLPAKYFPSFEHPDNLTRNFRDVFWTVASAKQHPDLWVHRFLRSCGWDVNKAFACILGVVEWRAAEAVDQVNWEGEAQLGLDELRLGILQLVGQDRLGFPLMYVRVRRIMPRANQLFVLKRYLIHNFEMLQYATRSYSRITMLYDFTGFSMDNTPFGMVHFLVNLGMKHYAETTSVLILLVDSWLFTNFWSLIRPFLDVNLSARIVFAKNVNDVLTFIDKSQLPVELGGENEFAVQFKLPEINENAKLFDTKKREQAEIEWRQRIADFEKATHRWCSHYESNSSDEYSAMRDKAGQELDYAERQLGSFTRACNALDRQDMVDYNGCLYLPVTKQ